MDQLSTTLSELNDLAYASATEKLHWGEFLTEVSRTFRDAKQQAEMVTLCNRIEAT